MLLNSNFVTSLSRTLFKSNVNCLVNRSDEINHYDHIEWSCDKNSSDNSVWLWKVTVLNFLEFYMKII